MSLLIGNEDEIQESILVSIGFDHKNHNIRLSLLQRHDFTIGEIGHICGGSIVVVFEWASMVDFTGEMASGLIELKSIRRVKEILSLGATSPVVTWLCEFTACSLMISASNALVEVED